MCDELLDAPNFYCIDFNLLSKSNAIEIKVFLFTLKF